MEKIDFKLKGKCGVYMIFNLQNGKRYVGSSVDIYNRLHEHLHILIRNEAHNKHLQNAWNKYGKDNFIYCVLEYCDKDKQFEREQYYIDLIKPEYNLTLNVIANYGHKVTEETKSKISKTLKERYDKGEIKAYTQDAKWIKTWIYNIRTFKLEAICKCNRDACKLLNNKHSKLEENKVVNNRYLIRYSEFKDLYDFINFVYKNIYKTRSQQGTYIVTEKDGELHYHKSLVECARDNLSSKSTLGKHADARKENPYIIRSNGAKFYYSNEYIPIEKGYAVPIEKSSELLSGNIGENPAKENPEINSEIAKGSESSYSVGGE